MKFKPLILFAAIVSLVCWSKPSQASEAQCHGQRLVILGDSLVAGYGLAPGEDFPSRLAVALKQDGIDIEIVNAGVSGDTTSGGLARLEWSVPEDADAVLVELGANDALRGIPVEVTRKNMEAIITKLQSTDKDVMLAGMLAPPNMGIVYGEAFNRIYPDMSRLFEIDLYPFFLEGVAADPELNQADGIHPTAKGVEKIVRNILPPVKEFLTRVCSR